jgi:hypothetical protein
MSAQSSDNVTTEVPSAISVNVALDAAIGIFTGRLGSYSGDLEESAATRAERYTALAWRHPALLPE